MSSPLEEDRRNREKNFILLLEFFQKNDIDIDECCGLCMDLVLSVAQRAKITPTNFLVDLMKMFKLYESKYEEMCLMEKELDRFTSRHGL